MKKQSNFVGTAKYFFDNWYKDTKWRSEEIDNRSTNQRALRG